MEYRVWKCIIANFNTAFVHIIWIIRGLNTKEQIAAVKYGQEITDQAIKTNMDTVIAQGNAVMEGIVKQYLETAVPETKTDVKDTENTTDGTDNIEDAATEKSSKKA